MRTSSFVLIILIALSACSTTTRRAEEHTGIRTTVRVENQNLLDMTVYILHEGQRTRLGTVPSLSTRVFTIPDEFVSGATPLQFLADPIGRRQTPISQEITVTPGEEIELLIPNY